MNSAALRAISIPLLATFSIQLFGCGEPIKHYEIGWDAYEKKNYSVAVANFRKCAAEPRCQELLGYMLMHGQGIAKNQIDAVKSLKIAAEKDLQPAQEWLGDAYYSGAGVERDSEEAIRWYELAANQGSARSQYMLGVLSERGYDIPKNNRKAFHSYRLAAEQGYGPAQYALANMHFEGKGTPPDNVQALEWYRLAMDNGIAGARDRLCHMYGNIKVLGSFSGKPKVVAYALCSVQAMEGGESERMKLNWLEKSLSRNEVKVGKDLASAIYGEEKQIPILDYYLATGEVNAYTRVRHQTL
jgi:TPR repeat protein